MIEGHRKQYSTSGTFAPKLVVHRLQFLVVTYFLTAE